MKLLLAGFLLLQESSPADTFAKIEKSLESARTIRITFKVEGTLKQGDSEKKTGKWGALLLRQGNKVHLRVTQGENSELLVSDGKTMLFDSWTGKRHMDRTLTETPEDLNRRIVGALLRAGHADSILKMVGRVHTIKPDPLENRVPSVFVHGNEDGAARILNYKVGVLDATLRYDPTTLRIFSRSLTHKDFGSVKESFDAFTVNDPIPDSEFTVFPDNLRD